MELYGSRGRDAWDLLARALAASRGIAPLPRVARTEDGKPWFPSRPELRFSLSHSGPLALVALSDRPVGVDIEQIRPRRAGLPRYALTAEELARYEALGGDWPAFYALWTRREAWCKYTGLGLQRSWGVAPGPARYGAYAGDGWRAAVCGEEDPPRTIVWLDGEEGAR